MGDRLPLPTLLSFALVAYTIEFDNEAEHQLPHRTTRHGATAGSGPKPWLVSLAMCLGYGLFSTGRDAFHPRQDDQAADANLPLPALLSRVLLAFAIEFERDSKVSLAVSANVLRVLTEGGVRVRDLPMLTGISKEAVAMSAKYLETVGCVAIEPVPAPDRGQRLRLTAKGRAAQQYAGNLISTVETEWQTRFGTDAVRSIRLSLEPLVGDGTASSPLFAGLKPYPDGWRAAVPQPSTLPHYPVVLHRGGFPDGS